MTHCFKRTLAMGLVCLLLVPYASNVALADPGTYVEVVPSSFVAGQENCTIYWDYDFEHDTIIWAGGPSGLIEIVHRLFPGGDRNSYTWRGTDESGQPVEEGWYTITVEPQDEWSGYAHSDTVYVFAPLPPPPPPPSWQTVGPVFTSAETVRDRWAIYHIVQYSVSASLGYRSPANLYFGDEGDCWLGITTPTGSGVEITNKGEVSASVPVSKDTDVGVGFGPLPRSVHYAVTNQYAFPEEEAESLGQDFFFEGKQEIKQIFQAKPWVSDVVAVGDIVVLVGGAIRYLWPILRAILVGAAALETPEDGQTSVDKSILQDLLREEPDDTVRQALADAMGPEFADCCELVPIGVPESIYAGQTFAVAGDGFSPGVPISLAVGLAGESSPFATARPLAGEDGSFATALSLPVDAPEGDYLVLAFDEESIKTTILQYADSGGTIPLRYVVGAAYLSVACDTNPPLTEVSVTPSSPDGQAGWYVTSPSVSLSATDNELGVAETLFRIDGGEWTDYAGPFTLESGVHVLDYFSVDLAGNSEPRRTVTIQVDTTLPEVDYAGPENWVNAPARVIVTSQDTPSGTGLVFLETDAGLRFEALCSPLVADFSQEGFYRLECGARDVAGNESAVLDGWFGLDYGPPVLVAVPDRAANAQGWYNAPVTVAFEASDPNLADGHVGSGVATVSDPVVVDWEGFGIPVEGLAIDVAGNEGSASVSLNIDVTPPTAALTIEGGPEFADSSIVKLSVRVEDSLSGVFSTSVFLDGVPLQGDQVELWQLPLGPHTLVLRVTDRAGNSATVEAAFSTRATILSIMEVKHILASLGWLGTVPGTTKSLDAKLEAALAAAKRGQTTAFGDIMRAFINEVRALEGTRITTQAAGILIRDAEFLIANGAGI